MSRLGSAWDPAKISVCLGASRGFGLSGVRWQPGPTAGYRQTERIATEKAWLGIGFGTIRYNEYRHEGKAALRPVN